jgi:hypothetical protein
MDIVESNIAYSFKGNEHSGRIGQEETMSHRGMVAFSKFGIQLSSQSRKKTIEFRHKVDQTLEWNRRTNMKELNSLMLTLRYLDTHTLLHCLLEGLQSFNEFKKISKSLPVFELHLA